MSQPHWGNQNATPTDAQLQEITDRVVFRIVEDPPDELLEAIEKYREKRVYEWFGRQVFKLLIFLVGAGAIGAYAFVKYLEAKGVI